MVAKRIKSSSLNLEENEIKLLWVLDIMKILFSVYQTSFWNLHVTLLFGKFTKGVFRILNIAPTRLYPNSWELLKPFKFYSSYYVPTLGFLLFASLLYSSWGEVGWLSMVSRMNAPMLTPYATSYKNFKTSFFKVLVVANGRNHMFTNDSKEKF